MKPRSIDYGSALIFIIAVGCGAFTVIDTFGWWDSTRLFHDRLPVATAALLVAVSLYLIHERRSGLIAIAASLETGFRDTRSSIADNARHLEGAVTDQIDRIIQLRGDTEVIKLHGREVYTARLAKRIKTAKESIDVTHFTSSSSTDWSPLQTAYYESYADLLKRQVKVRRVVLVNNRAQLDWVTQMLHDYADDRFYLSCYPKQNRFMPEFSIVIIDGDEVWLTGGPREQSLDPDAVIIKHPSIASVVQAQFDALYRGGYVMNEPRSVVPDQFLQILMNALDAPSI